MDADNINWHFLELPNKNYEGFEKSLDVYNDGSIVLVDISGHSADLTIVPAHDELVAEHLPKYPHFLF